MRIDGELVERLLARMPGLSSRQAVETAIRYYLDVAENVEPELGPLPGPDVPAGPSVERRDPSSPGARLRPR